MDSPSIYCAGGTPALRYAKEVLQEMGLPVSAEPNAEVRHLLLDVPSFQETGQLRMGGHLEPLLVQLPTDITVYGGNLNHPALRNYRTVDFLKDPFYLAENAYITAECALDVALPYLTVTLRDCPTLIIGWGRIGKCLGVILKGIGANVTVAARKETDRAMAQALGYAVLDTAKLPRQLHRFRLIYNTVPELILKKSETSQIDETCTVIDLASKQGIEYDDLIIARGLPGIHMPESSGKLIAQTFLYYYNKEVTP